MDCISQILEFYNMSISEENHSPDDMNKVWLSKLLIKLMQHFNEGQLDDLNLRNCLILLVNLFSDTYGPDHYCRSGKNVRDLPPEDSRRERKIRRAGRRAFHSPLSDAFGALR